MSEFERLHAKVFIEDFIEGSMNWAFSLRAVESRSNMCEALGLLLSTILHAKHCQVTPGTTGDFPYFFLNSITKLCGPERKYSRYDACLEHSLPGI